jgi:IclR family mhp operon transcriptional activator
MIESGVPIRSASRAFAVLRAINEFGSASLSEIARHERLPHPTAFRIMQTLVHEGLIERETSGKRYHPTSLVQSLASGYDNSVIRRVAEPILSALTKHVGWPVFLSERVGRRLVIRASTHHETSLTFYNWKAGCSFPLLGSVTGLAWLAHQPESCARDLIKWETESETQQFIFEGEELLRSLGQVRSAGYAWCPSRYERNGNTASLALPIFKGDRVNDVVTLTYFASAMKPHVAVERYVDVLRQAADGIAASL